MYYGEEQEEEIKKHLKQYINDENTTKDLVKCCERCEEYLGNEHDFNQCSDNCPILKLWYEVKYWRWYNSWD